MNGGRAQQARCDERAARDLREREWGQRNRDKSLRFRLSDYFNDRSILR